MIKDKALLIEVKEYMEKTQEKIDGEWGSGREIDELISDNMMPALYTKILEAIKEFK